LRRHGTEEEHASRGNYNFLVVARLRNGVSIAKAQAAMNVISDGPARDYPERDKGWCAIVTSLHDNLVADVRPALLALLGAVAFVLLIACANTANLVLARTIVRIKELAIRAALGASSGQVLHPVLIETTLLAVAGGALGLLVAGSGQFLLTRAVADQLLRAAEVQIDARVLAFTLVASVVTMTVPIPHSAGSEHRTRLYDEFLPRVAALPGVESAAAINDRPMMGGSEQPIAVEGSPMEVFALQRNFSVREATRTISLRCASPSSRDVISIWPIGRALSPSR
jgi:HAMP domain-containing protein